MPLLLSFAFSFGCGGSSKCHLFGKKLAELFSSHPDLGVVPRILFIVIYRLQRVVLWARANAFTSAVLLLRAANATIEGV
jgi:hypothetical protein